MKDSHVNAEEHLVHHYATMGELKSDFRNYNLFQLVTSMVTGESVVDIGCGPANLLSILKSRGKKVKGIEPSGEMRELAHKINPEIIILNGGAEDVDSIVMQPVDTVIMADVLEHIEEDEKQIKKIHSVLKPEGEFIFVVPAYQSLYGLRDKQMGHYRRYSKSELIYLLEENGFQIEKARYWNMLGVLPYFVSEKILKKPLESKLRKEAKSPLSGLMQKVLNWWFRKVENNFDFGFGLSIIGRAKKL